MNSVTGEAMDRGAALMRTRTLGGRGHLRFPAKIWINQIGQFKESIESGHSASGSILVWRASMGAPRELAQLIRQKEITILMVPARVRGRSSEPEGLTIH
jgi:hypothetical protein